MLGENVVFLGGNLGKDPIYYGGTEGKDAIPRCTFPLIVDSFSAGTEKKEAYKFNIIAWGKQCEFLMKHLHKGTFLVLRGSLHNRTYNDREGKPVNSTEIRVEKVIEIRSPKTVNV